jgi:ethanolamine utilization protein EutQ (cupin superfamily)
MAQLIARPRRIAGGGVPEKVIEEFTGRASNGEERVSVARMRSPAGWRETGQCPDFDEYTVVLSGVLRVETHEGTLHVGAHQAVLVRSGEWVRYSTPGEAEYLSVCMPAYSPETVNRDSP